VRERARATAGYRRWARQRLLLGRPPVLDADEPWDGAQAAKVLALDGLADLAVDPDLLDGKHSQQDEKDKQAEGGYQEDRVHEH
jgi:hypothetical protein